MSEARASKDSTVSSLRTKSTAASEGSRDTKPFSTPTELTINDSANKIVQKLANLTKNPELRKSLFYTPDFFTTPGKQNSLTEYAIGFQVKTGFTHSLINWETQIILNVIDTVKTLPQDLESLKKLMENTHNNFFNYFLNYK